MSPREAPGGLGRGEEAFGRTLTRRTVLRGAAVAGAASLVRPATGLAAGAGPATAAVSRSVFSRWVGSFARESAVIAAPRSFSLVGVEWAAPGHARIELRARPHGGAWSAWTIASSLGHDPDGPERSAGTPGGSSSSLFGEPIWTGPASEVQLRTAGPVRGVRLHFVAPAPAGSSPAPAPTARAAQAFPLADPVLDAGAGQPPIIARQAWAQGQAPHARPEYGTIKLAFVHHSVTPNGYSAEDVPSILLSIFDYHRYVRGFFDIAYNFAIDAFGRTWEARAGGIDLPVIGAQAGGYNAESTGVVVLGTFTDVVPSAAAIDALERLLAWKLSLHGLPTLGTVTVVVDPADYFYTPFGPGTHVALPRIAGHRQGDSTDCPGDAFFAQLPSIRPRVAALVGDVRNLTLSATPATVTAGGAVDLSGQLSDLRTGRGEAGAQIELQQITPAGEKTIATLTTDGGGGWTSSLAPAQNVLVRALRRRAPAAVSEPALIGVAPVVTLTLVSVSPPQVSGTVSPAKRFVTVDLYKLDRGHRRRVASRRVRAAGGHFAARIKPAGAGRYVLIARTAADVRNVAGASAPLELTVP
jgi:N-acetylmuramoyl-L-alanine amidase